MLERSSDQELDADGVVAFLRGAQGLERVQLQSQYSGITFRFSL